MNGQCPPNHSRDEKCQLIRICERVTVVCPTLFVSTRYTVKPRSRLIRMMTPVCTLTTYFTINLNIVLPSLRKPFRFFNKFSIKHNPNSKKILYSYNASLESRVLLKFTNICCVIVTGNVYIRFNMRPFHSILIRQVQQLLILKLSF
jgi:hypothetical protein